MLVQHLLESASEQWPDKEALVCGGERVTYGWLEAESNRLANALLSHNVRQGDRVVILLENSIEAVVAMFAVLKAGAIFLVLHPSMKSGRFTNFLDDAEPSGLVTDQVRMREHEKVVAQSRSLRCVVSKGSDLHCMGEHTVQLEWSALQSFPPERPPCTSCATDLAALVYTSGSTGQPKGVMCSHANMIAATNAVNAYLKNTSDDVILNVLPLSFGYGLYQILLACQVGAKVVLEKNFAFPARVIALIEQEGITAIPSVPTFFALLLNYPDLLKHDFPRVRYITTAAAALPSNHLQQIRRVFPHSQLFSMYGQTECKRVSYLPPEYLESKPLSVGIPIQDSEVYIINEAGERLPAGEIGELVVSGPHVMQGYWRSPELTALKFQPGPRPGEKTLYTGDLFRMDDEGFLYFVARKDDLIKCRGQKVSPKEVESIVCELPSVSEAAVLGIPDPILGQAIHLLVVPRTGATLTEREIRAYCARTLEDYMVPKYVSLVKELPRTENGKINRREAAAINSVVAV